MPKDLTTYRFACDICGDQFEADNAEEAHGSAAACEVTGLEAEPLPEGTPLLVSEWVREGTFSQQASRRRFRITRIAEWTTGSGRYNNGAGHRVDYRLEGEERVSLRPRDISPHRRARLNTTFTPALDTRGLGDHLDRVGHNGTFGEQLDAAAALVSELSGVAVEGQWLGAVFGNFTMPRRRFPGLAPREDLPEALLGAIDALARPIGEEDLPADTFTERPLRHRDLMRIEGDTGMYRARFPLAMASAWALALEASGGHLPSARAFLLCHQEDLVAILRARSDAWWAGAPVPMPLHLLVPNDGTKSGGLSAGQLKALEAVGDVQLEARRRSSYEGDPEWRPGAIRVLSEPPTRSNQKKARFTAANALAGLAGDHPEIRSISVMSDPTRPQLPVICVASGKGGVGKSTVAASLAMALTGAGHPALLVDLDLEGPSLPALLDLPPAIAAGEMIAPHVLPDGTAAFSPGQVFSDSRALTWDRVTLEAMVAFLAGALDATGRSVMVVDLPPGTPAVQMLVNRAWSPAGTLLVTTGSGVAHADLRRAHAVARNPIGIVENLTRAELVIDGRTIEARLYDGASTEDLAAGLGTPYLGSLPHRPAPADLAAEPEMAPLVEAALAALAAAAAEPARPIED